MMPQDQEKNTFVYSVNAVLGFISGVCLSVLGLPFMLDRVPPGSWGYTRLMFVLFLWLPAAILFSLFMSVFFVRMAKKRIKNGPQKRSPMNVTINVVFIFLLVVLVLLIKKMFTIWLMVGR
jgi:hypothetical protein